jgi:hypothetical protein
MRIVLHGNLAPEAFVQAERGPSRLVARIKALRSAVRGDNFRMAQRLRLTLPLYVRQLKAPLRDEVVRLFEVSGLWVRNLGDRRETKRSTLQIVRRIVSRLKIPTRASVAGAKLAALAR